MKKIVLIVLLLISLSSLSQNMRPIIITSEVFTSIGGDSFILNPDSDTIGGFESLSNTVGFEKLKINSYLIYPNPSYDFINIKDVSNVKVYDQFKVLIIEDYTNKIDILKLSTGVYFLTINNNNPIKFIKL